MTSIHRISYTCLPYSFVTDEILAKCSTLFNNNYGIWSNTAPHYSNNVLQAGARVRLGVKRIREQLLFNNRCFLVIAELRSFDNDQSELVGHAFCTWAKYDRLNGNAVWITQLVVSSPYRSQGIAGTLISMAKNNVEDLVVVGIVSSHPHAVLASSSACNRIPINLEFITDHAEDVIRVCEVPYLSQAQLVGSVFERQSLPVFNNNQQPVSLVKTDFFVDHKEPLTFFHDIRNKWILGPLLDGHEFLVVLPATSVCHSTFSSSRSSTDDSPSRK